MKTKILLYLAGFCLLISSCSDNLTSNPEPLSEPRIETESGTYFDSVTITLSHENSSADIFYTTDGSTPHSGSNLYSSPFSLTSHSKVKAIATADGHQDSPVTEATFNVVETGTMTDQEGRLYRTVMIGGREWMAENLRVTTYRNGDPIPPAAEGFDWLWQDDGYAVYDHAWTDGLNSAAHVTEIYGLLYNWDAVDHRSGLCPTGWRVPTDQDWTDMQNYLMDQHGLNNEPQDEKGIGNALKDCRQVDSPLGGDCLTSEHPRFDDGGLHNMYGTDTFGFSALPGGYRAQSSRNVGERAYFWTSTRAPEHSLAFSRSISSNSSLLHRTTSQTDYGFSVRCINN